jgi:hypothetical protein
MHFCKVIISAALLALMAGCSGGGDTGTPAGPPTQALTPSATAPAPVTVTETVTAPEASPTFTVDSATPGPDSGNANNTLTPTPGTNATVGANPTLQVTGDCKSAFKFNGEGFTPNGPVLVHVFGPDGPYPAAKLANNGVKQADANGHVTGKWNCSGDKPGNYQITYVDDTANRKDPNSGKATANFVVT